MNDISRVNVLNLPTGPVDWKAQSIAFGPDGHLYVMSQGGDVYKTDYQVDVADGKDRMAVVVLEKGEDEEGRWYAHSDDVTGLHLTASSREALISDLPRAIRFLVEANKITLPPLSPPTQQPS